MLPLISYCVKCYNQEHYIQQALKAAFAQTYEPLEILICDDCSTDRSDEVIRKAIADYQAHGGRHQIRYYRNEKNLGNLGNWQRICELAAGELLVKADGDDYSAPERVAHLMAAWNNDGKRATYLYSDGWAVNEHGQKMWDMVLNESYCIGAFEAYAKSCCTEFGTTNPAYGHEAADDVVYIERGMMLGKGLHVPEKLVYYRQGSGETSSGLNFTRMMTRGFRFMLASGKQLLEDVGSCKFALPEELRAQKREKFGRMVAHHQALMDLWLGKNLLTRCDGYRRARQMHVISWWFGGFLLLPGWINKPCLNVLFGIHDRLRSLFRCG